MSNKSRPVVWVIDNQLKTGLPPQDGLCYDSPDMSVETRSEHRTQDGPPLEDDPEMILPTVLRNLVEDLFTHQPINEALQGSEWSERVETLVNQWKAGLTEHWQEMAALAIDNFLADLERVRAGQDPTFSLYPVRIPRPKSQPNKQPHHKPSPNPTSRSSPGPSLSVQKIGLP